MDKLIDLLREAFDAGTTSAHTYEHGGRGQRFVDWLKENESEINSCTDFNIRKSLEESTHELFHLNAYVDELHDSIKSDAIFNLLNDAQHRPVYNNLTLSSYKEFNQLYNISKNLRHGKLE